MKKAKFCVLIVTVIPVLAFAYFRSLEDLVSHKMKSLMPQIMNCCEKNGEIFEEEKCLSYKCKELDELGGQPLVTDEIAKEADQWIQQNMGTVSRFYLKETPKSNLLGDKKKKERQDMVMDVVEELRKVICYGYSQCSALGLSKDKFLTIASIYKALMQSGAWRDIGDRQQVKVEKSADALSGMLEKIHLVNVSIYDSIVKEKKLRYAAFANAHPMTAQTALAIQRAKKAERRAAVAENIAANARMEAEAASVRASKAEAAAAVAESAANDANRRAAAAENKATWGL